MDEVDASLDTANIDRVSYLLLFFSWEMFVTPVIYTSVEFRYCIMISAMGYYYEL